MRWYLKSNSVSLKHRGNFTLTSQNKCPNHEPVTKNISRAPKLAVGANFPPLASVTSILCWMAACFLAPRTRCMFSCAGSKFHVFPHLRLTCMVAGHGCIICHNCTARNAWLHDCQCWLRVWTLNVFVAEHPLQCFSALGILCICSRSFLVTRF